MPGLDHPMGRCRSDGQKLVCSARVGIAVLQRLRSFIAATSTPGAFYEAAIEPAPIRSLNDRVLKRSRLREELGTLISRVRPLSRSAGWRSRPKLAPQNTPQVTVTQPRERAIRNTPATRRTAPRAARGSIRGQETPDFSPSASRPATIWLATSVEMVTAAPTCW